ncbi:MAG: 1-acyl-sn-glycerol-3-phosphate acyltransferase [Candidatus Levybacteria bacterium]|nr:1-acyl-sn-glycerol-3-phosphate acyltransferase [Candidatus Levybacteria bacterium]
MLEQIAERIGRVIKPHFYTRVENSINAYNLYVYNIENLELLKGNPCVFVANHIKPEGDKNVYRSSGLSPDSFLLRRVILNTLGQDVHFVAQYDPNDLGTLRDKIPGARSVLKRFHKGMLRGFDVIPVSKRTGAVNVDFFRDAKTAVARKESIFIYPFEDWMDDFNPEQKIESGAAYLAQKLDVPIFPIYVFGCKTWNPKPNQETTIVFGKPFSAKGITIEQTNSKIREELTALQNLVRAKNHEQ